MVWTWFSCLHFGGFGGSFSCKFVISVRGSTCQNVIVRVVGECAGVVGVRVMGVPKLVSLGVLYCAGVRAKTLCDEIWGCNSCISCGSSCGELACLV